MNTGKTLFARLMDFLPWTTFTRIAARYDGDVRGRTLCCAEQYRAMAFAQLTYRESLHDIEVNRIGKHGVVKVNLWKSRNCAEHDIFDAGLAGCGNGNRITVTAKTAGDPQDMNLGDIWPMFAHSSGFGLLFLRVRPLD
jgi:Domain of unknown function (DUF4372)